MDAPVIRTSVSSNRHSRSSPGAPRSNGGAAIRLALSLLIVLLTPPFAAGCRSKAQPAVIASASASTAASAGSAPNVDAALLAALVKVADECKVDAAQGIVSCAKGELRALVAKFATNQESHVKALPTLTAALKHGRPEVRAATASLLHAAFSSSWGPDAKPGAVTPAEADAFLKATLALVPIQQRQALPAAVHASLLSGSAEQLYSALDKNLPSDAKATAYRYLMTHGRLQAFAKVKELAKDPDTAVVLAALENPRNMNLWTEEERAAICPWAVEFLADQRPVVVAKAAGVLASCNGAPVDKLLDTMESSLQAKTLFTAKISAFRDLCLPRQRTDERGPSDEQCDRSRKLLESAVDNKALDAQARGMALVALAHQWPDKRTLTLAKRYEKSSEKVLAEHAGRVVARLDQVQRAQAGTRDPRDGARTSSAARASTASIKSMARPAAAPASPPAAPPPEPPAEPAQ